jgi:hypothetical protein
MSKKIPLLKVFVVFLCLQGCPQGEPVDNEETKPVETQQDAGRIIVAPTDAGVPPNPVPELDAGHLPVMDAGAIILDSGISEEVLCEGCVRSALFPQDWTPESSSPEGYFLHDFSYAGYHHSERDLPQEHDHPVFNILDYGADATGNTDSTAAIQSAINAAQENGSGIVSFPQGQFWCANNLTITSSNIILRGAGTFDTFMRFSKTNANGAASILFKGNLTQGSDRLLSYNAYNRDRTVSIPHLQTPDGGVGAEQLAVGDDVLLGFTITPSFIQEHGMSAHWGPHNNFPSLDQWRPFFRRTIAQIETLDDLDVITFDVPLRYPLKVRDNASIRKVTGHLEEVGIEKMSLSNAIHADDAWAQDRVHVLEMNQVKNGWIQDLTSFQGEGAPSGYHLQSGGLLIKMSKNVTVADTTFKFAQNRGAGGNGYLFEVMQSNEILIRDSVGKAGRHNFVQNWDFGTSGLVFLRTHSSEGKSLNSQNLQVGLTGYSEFHHALAIANLIDDSTASDGWAAVNRRDYSSGAGVTATQTVFWNLK